MSDPTIKVQTHGPYTVSGGIPLRRKRAIVSEHDERLNWQNDPAEPQEQSYALCRCGGSSNKPFCDGTHASNDFDGTETAPTDTYEQRRKHYPGTGIDVYDDRSICAHAGFCGNKVSDVWKMSDKTADTVVRAQVMSMVERCPSGALTYEVEGDAIEPAQPTEVSITLDGPLWVTGGVPVKRADGKSLETRNRVALCRCGHSANKPLCDGSHFKAGFKG